MSDLHAQQAGPESQMDWISSRAAGKHFQVVLDILRATASSEMYREMRLAPPSHPPMDPENEYLRGDVELVQKAWDFAVNLASNILWGQLLYRYTLPLGSAGLLAETTAPCSVWQMFNCLLRKTYIDDPMVKPVKSFAMLPTSRPETQCWEVVFAFTQ